eukprot:2066608-Amphidinium_carterae.1
MLAISAGMNHIAALVVRFFEGNSANMFHGQEEKDCEGATRRASSTSGSCLLKLCKCTIRQSNYNQHGAAQ